MSTGESLECDSGNCNYCHFKNHLPAMQCTCTEVVTVCVINVTVRQNLNVLLRVNDSLLAYCL